MTALRWTLLGAAIAAVVCLAPSDAAAEDRGFEFGHDAEAYLLGGLTTGGAFGSSGGGGFLGGEFSLVWLKETIWGGLYVDGAYDFGHEAATFTIGPEFGWTVLGIDGGAGMRVGVEDDPEFGIAARGLIGLGVLSVFGRYNHWFESSEEHIGQVGILIKFPFWNSTAPPAIAR